MFFLGTGHGDRTALKRFADPQPRSSATSPPFAVIAVFTSGLWWVLSSALHNFAHPATGFAAALGPGLSGVELIGRGVMLVFILAALSLTYRLSGNSGRNQDTVSPDIPGSRAESSGKQSHETGLHGTIGKELEKTRDFTRYVMESSLDMIVAVDGERRIVEFNRAAQETFGYSLDEIIGKPVDILYANHEESEKIAGKIRRNGFFTGEIWNRRKNGEPFLTYLSSSLIRDNTGAVIGAVGNSRDITDEKKAAERLLEMKSLLNAIFEGANDSLYAKDAEGHFIMINEAGARNAGKTADEMIGKTDYDIYPPGDAQRFREFDRRVMKWETPLTMEESVTVNGEERVLLSTKSPLMDENGAIRGIVGIGRDITELKRYQSALQKSEEKFHLLFENAPDIYLSISRNGHINSINAFGAERLGYDKHELTGKHVSLIVHPDDRETVLGSMENIFHYDIDEYEMEFREIRSEGSEIWIQGRSRLVHDEHSNEKELFAMCRDISFQKQAQEQIARSLEEKEVLLREVHHRVKNNMQVISSLLVLQSDRIDDPQYREMFQESINRIKAMAFIHDALYRSENFTRIGFRNYIASITENIANMYLDKSGTIAIHIDVEESAALTIDTAIPCSLIVNELVTNSFKYGFPDDRQGSITISMHEIGDGMIELTVADDGAGIDSTLDWENTESLGLKLVNLLGRGQLGGTVELLEGNGTCFRITFTP